MHEKPFVIAFMPTFILSEILQILFLSLLVQFCCLFSILINFITISYSLTIILHLSNTLSIIFCHQKLIQLIISSFFLQSLSLLYCSEISLPLYRTLTHLIPQLPEILPIPLHFHILLVQLLQSIRYCVIPPKGLRHVNQPFGIQLNRLRQQSPAQFYLLLQFL
jgi:hypothetical protein